MEKTISPIGQRIRDARDKRGWKQAELARQAGIPRQTLHGIERPGGTRNPGLDVMGPLANALGVSVAYLQRLTDDPNPSQNGQRVLGHPSHPTARDVFVPDTLRLSDVLPPGLLAEVTRYLPTVEQTIAASAWAGVTTEPYPAPARTPPNAFIIHVTGRCMVPRINPDDRVLVERRAPEPGEVVVAVRHQEATLKRYIEENGGHCVLRPDNPLFADIEIDDDTRIIGVVIDVFTGKP